MKVHFFVRTLDSQRGGGSHYNSIAYVRALRSRGHEVVVHVFSKGRNAFPEDITPLVHEGWGLSFRGSRSYLSELLKQYESEADVFFLYAVEFAWGGGLYRKQGGKVPVVVYMDAYLPSMNNVHRDSLKEWIYHFKRLPWDKTVGLSDARHVDRFLPCSPYIGEEYKKFGFPRDRFTVLPNIVADKSKPKHTHSDSSIHILYIGRLIYDKGIDLLIDALQNLKEFSWKLTIVGDGPMKEYVEAHKSNLPIEMIGWIPQEEVGKYYAEADLFVHPARWPDPAPRTVVDALHARLPMLVPDTGGSSWIAGKAGISFKTGDLVTLTEGLRVLLEDKDGIRSKLVSHAKDEAQKFSESRVGNELESILKSVL